MEGKSDQGGSHGLKILVSLKKHLFEHSDSSSQKSLTSREVSASFVDLCESVCTAAQKPNSGQLISQTVELLVHACSSQDQHIRIAASENLKKIIKVLMFTHLSRIQQDLFHELKKNGTSRSLCVALDCFAALFPLTRPSKCSGYAQSLLPIVVRLTNREEEALHEALQGALGKILPTMAPFLSTTNLQFLMTGLVNRLPTGSSTYRRMASSALTTIMLNCKSPNTQAEWLISKLLDLGCKHRATNEVVHGVLLIFQQLFAHLDTVSPPLSSLKQAFCFLVSCLLYRDTNTSISALESLHQLLLSATPDITVWMSAPQTHAQVAVDYWADDSSSCGTPIDTHSIGEGLDIACDSYFESDDLNLSYDDTSSNEAQPATSLSNVIAKSTADEEGPVSMTVGKVVETTCLLYKDGPQVVLESLVQYVVGNVLHNGRVSAQSLGLACMTAAVDIQPSLLLCLDAVTQFTTAQDPKLRNRAVKLLATVISSQLRSHHHDLSQCPPIVDTCCGLLVAMLDDDTPVVLKAVCEALQLCLPYLVASTKPQIVIDILHKLLPFRESSYWLTKVELLQTLGCLDFTSLAILNSQLPEVVLGEVIFQLLGDVDHRVRAAACQCLVQLAPNLDLQQDRTLSLAKSHSSGLFLHLTPSMGHLSLAGISDSMDKCSPKRPLGLEHLVWFLVGKISSSIDTSLQLGCLEALHTLCQHFPPPSLPNEWGCNVSPCTALDTLLHLLKTSKISWGVQAHGDLLEVTTSVFLSCALSYLPSTGRVEERFPDIQAVYLLSHVVKLLSVFVHVIEEREPELKEKKLTKPVLSPKKPIVSDSPSPSKPKSQPLDLFQKPPLVPRDGLGQFSNVPQFMRVYDACRAAYSNYKLSLGSVGTDKFSKLLQNCHNSLAALLEMATAEDIGKHVEEILGYISYTIKVDPAGGLLCVQQLLNALFGLNVAAQHTHLHSPYISSLPYNLITLQGSSAKSVYEAAVDEPLDQLFPWLHGVQASDKDGKKKGTSLLLGKKALLGKPANSVSAIKDYIGYFEPLVVHALGQFSSTSSTVLQQRVLFLLVQLLNLKVRYELLDCHHTFLDSVLKMVSLMETGVVKGGETLVPHLFQFLVLLAYDQSKLITIPEVMQKCDGVMASGHNVLTFAIPALQPLVLNLFVRPARESTDLEIQREVVMSMLLRLVEYSRVVTLLTHVLDCYRKKRQKWQQASGQIFAALLPQIGKLRVVLDSSGSLASLYQLLAAMDPSVISVNALFTAVLKPSELKNITSLVRWLGGVCTLLEFMVSSFQEKVVLDAVSLLSFTVPSLKTSVIEVERHVIEDSPDQASKLASFFRGALYLATSALDKLTTQRSTEDHGLLSFLAVNLLLLLQKLVSGSYTSLRAAFGCLPTSSALQSSVSNVATLYPLLTLTYINFNVVTTGIKAPLLLQYLVGMESTGASSRHLLQHTTLLLLNKQWLDSQLSADPLVCASLTKSPALLQHCQQPGIKKFIKFAQKEAEVQECLVELVKSTDITNIQNCVNVIRLASSIPCAEMLKFLCSSVIPSCVSAVCKAAESVAVSMLDGGIIELSVSEVAEISAVLHSQKERCVDLVAKLHEIPTSEGTLSEPSTPSLDTLDVKHINEQWYLEKVKDFCCVPGVNGDVAAVLLGSLDVEDLSSVIDDSNFPLGLLECCIAHGVFLSLNKNSLVAFDESVEVDFARTGPQTENVQPLLEVSVRRLVKAFKVDSRNPVLVFSMVRLLAARHQIPTDFLADDETLSAVLESSVSALSQAAKDSNLLHLGAALDYCALLLLVPRVREALSEDWICQVVTHIATVVKVYPVLKSKVDESFDDSLSGVERTQHQFLSMLSTLLETDNELATYKLGSSLRHLTLAMCRLPLFHEAVMTPAALKGDGKLSLKMLDQALMESEILVQFMQHGNFVGWLNRQQFEERWMQLLGVVNQPPPQEGEFPEEYQAYALNVSAGVQAVTSLLLSTLLRPNLGDPTSSVPMHTHRSIDLLFLGTRPGRKLSLVRKVVEQKIVLQCGRRSSLLDYYQSPIQHNVASLHYPPLYSHNLERQVGDTDIGVGQLSLNSLWPVMLFEAGTNNGYMSGSVEVDIKSCIISLIELYTHWLANPIHTLQLQYTLQSIVMLSDLFAVSSQIEWMLGTLLDLYDRHPQEDVYSLSLVVLGALKAAAILKLGGSECEKVSRIIEKSLAADSPLVIQSACVYGLLYLAEDPNSSLIPQVCSTATKFISGCLLNCHGYTDRILSAAWSLAVSLVLKHGNDIMDRSFTSGLLEQISLILHHSNCSFSLFHCITLGLELLVLNFSLSAEDRKAVSILAANRFLKCEQAKSLSALALLVTCMYTGEAANVASVPQTETLEVETTLQAREQINNLMDRLRHGPYADVQFLVDILPDLVVDFLPVMEVLQSVVTDFVSPHQTRPELAAVVLNKTFQLLMKRGEQALLVEWVLLSLESFVQQEPESKAVWSITCLLASISSDEHILALSKIICYWTNPRCSEALSLLCLVARIFYSQCSEQRQQEQFLAKLKIAKASSLRQVAEYCEQS